ncbi:hypothetical protein [Microbacterium imperiale]|uniref:Uncharacterized protein n=1 Tax=Microbacterium imperiale TaxID=33884 RepID=A0A9W6M4U4_9MICO|nr:hypothetical protein [Microbacterium imperiale]MBP2421841.1 hypothetical protein [Microbacterium imperiale]MDS0199058.1 hypothetical protein [Microbacterium imperiale]BFE39146.1 hypothetical protein GCM10017544_01020 [Microbacterium imperiale]GLJ81137.1 hypothetical protein GCM10017586_28200 [Microbacterium imperiale]
MVDKRTEAHGPGQLPDRQPRPDPTDLTNQESFRQGSSSRWLVPAGVLAAVAIVLYALAFQLQVVLPAIGIVFTVVAWAMMLVASRSSGDAPVRNRRLAVAMGILAVGALAIFIGIYLVETLGAPGR